MASPISRDKIWAVILAAGAAKRFGAVKALARFGNGTLLSHVQGMAQKLLGARVKIVLGAHSDDIAPFVPSDQITLNPQWQQGMGTSIAAGIRAVVQADEATEALLILLVDQPLISLPHLEKLMDQGAETNLCQFTEDRGVIGPPAILTAPYFDRALALKGDKGLKSCLEIEAYAIQSAPGAMIDVDTEADLERLHRSLEKS